MDIRPIGQKDLPSHPSAQEGLSRLRTTTSPSSALAQLQALGKDMADQGLSFNVAHVD